jgi:hypothetical protein
MSSRSVHYNHLHILLAELSDTLLGDAHGVSLRIRAVERNTQFSCILLQLIEGSGAESIGANHGSTPALALVVVGEFSYCCRLTRSLQAHKHNYIRLPFLHHIRLRLRV